MSGGLVFLSFAVFICKVHSQLCSPPILPTPCPAPCVPIPCQPAIPPCPVACPQVINPNPCVTTIIDNSVSNALVNALQLLIVSNLIGATVGPSTPLINNLGPLLDSIVCSNPCPVEVVIPEYPTYGVNYDFIPPYGPGTCGPYYDIIPPYGPITACGPSYEFIPPCGPITTWGPSYDLIPPCGPIVDPYCPPLCNLNDIISPNYFTYTETITPICIDSLPYNGYGDLILPMCGIEAIGPNLCGGLGEILPNYINYPVPDIYPPLNPYYGGFADFGCFNDIVAPCLPSLAVYGPELPVGSLVSPNYFGGLPDLTVPLAAEVMFPSTVPTPLSCNYGYAPPSLPCVRVNMETLPYDSCLYNGYGGPIYY